MQKHKIRPYEYDDAYPVCVETYSTLRIFSDNIPPDEIAKLLNIQPTEFFQKGDAHNRGKLKRKAHGWFYCTRKLCSSKDSRRHIDLILSALDKREKVVKGLLADGCKIDIATFWLSTGQGGPWLMPEQMLKLGTLGIDIQWDIYFADEEEEGVDAAGNVFGDPK